MKVFAHYHLWIVCLWHGRCCAQALEEALFPFFFPPNKVFLGCKFSWCFGDLWCLFCFRNFQIWLIQAGSSNWFTPWFDLLKPPLPHFLGWIASHWRNNKDMLNWSFEKQGKVEDLVLRCTCYISIFIYIFIWSIQHTDKHTYSAYINFIVSVSRSHGRCTQQNSCKLSRRLQRHLIFCTSNCSNRLVRCNVGKWCGERLPHLSKCVFPP